MTPLKPYQLITALRLSEIPRWTIVPMLRQQTVGEHTYRVWLMAIDLYKTMEPTSHNTDEFKNLQEYALLHDLAEVVTGDIPTTVKRSINETNPGLLHAIEARALQDIHPDAAGVIRSVSGSFEGAIVKICDSLEAYMYIEKYGANDKYTKTVKEDIKYNLFVFFKKSTLAFSHKSWYTAVQWVNGVCPSISLEIDTDPED